MGKPDCFGVKLAADALKVDVRTIHRYVRQGMPHHVGCERVDGFGINVADAQAWREERSVLRAAGRIFRALPWAVVRYREARRGRAPSSEQLAMWAA